MKLFTSKFMEISDFHCHEWIDISSVMIMKNKLDTLTGREFIEEDWEGSNEFSTKEQNQYYICLTTDSVLSK